MVVAADATADAGRAGPLATVARRRPRRSRFACGRFDDRGGRDDRHRRAQRQRKSTLLGLLGGLDRPSGGRVILDGIDISELSEDRITEIRNEKIGFIFQFFNLIPTLNALENVALPLQFARRPQFRPEKRARELLVRLGLGDRLRHRPAELSGGQQQRVAIARALANQPPLLLADEPTGNLDRAASDELLALLHEIRAAERTTIVVVTHDSTIANSLDRALLLEDGRLVASGKHQ